MALQTQTITATSILISSLNISMHRCGGDVKAAVEWAGDGKTNYLCWSFRRASKREGSIPSKSSATASAMGSPA